MDSPAPSTVAFCGLGHLGGQVGDALIASPHRVRAYDPRPEALDPRVAAGAEGAASAADAADGADVSIVFVRDDAQALDAVAGPDGLLRAARPGSVVIVHSTVAPDTVRALAAACADAGVELVDAGISTGGGRPIGQLYAMCGGPVETIDSVRPVLDVYCSDVVRFGPLGAGMAAKLVRNAMRYALYGVLYEGMAFAEAAGLDLAAMSHLYRGTFGHTSDDDMVLDRTTMVPLHPDDPAADPEFVAQMSSFVTLGWKDLDDAYELADEVGHDVAIARAARALYGPALGLDLRGEDRR